MRRWATFFFCMAVLSGVIGFRDDASVLTEISHILSYVFMVAFLVTVVSDFLRGGAR